ncbi:unnamed protein product, partial [Acidithrix sp. C25]
VNSRQHQFSISSTYSKHLFALSIWLSQISLSSLPELYLLIRAIFVSIFLL